MLISVFYSHLLFSLTLLPAMSSALSCNGSHETEGLYALKQFITPAAIVGKADDRVPISGAYKGDGLSDKEYQQSLTSTGMVYCPTVDGRMASAVASIAGSRDQVLTVAHIFSEDNGTPRLIERCYFANYAHPNEHYTLSVNPGDFNLGRDISDRKSDQGDYAMIRLKKPVNEAVPYQFGWNEKAFAVGDHMTVITANFNAKNLKMNREPKVQTCSVIASYRGDGHGKTVIENDCDSTHGDSGAIHLIRSADGKLVLRGLNVGEIVGSTDYCPPEAEKCGSVAVEFSDAALEMFKRVLGPSANSSSEGQDL